MILRITRLFLSFLIIIFGSIFNVSAQQSIELKLQKGHSEKINQILFTPSGNRLISCSDDQTIKLWDVKSGKELRTFVGHKSKVQSIAINRQGTTIFSGGGKKEKKVFVWDAVTGEKKSEIKGFEGSIGKVSFSQYGRRIAVLEKLPSFQSRVSVWDESFGTKRFDLKLPADFTTNAIAFHPGNNHLVVGGKFLKKQKPKSVIIYSSDDGSILQTLEGTAGNIKEIYYSRRGNLVAIVGSNIQIWRNRGESYSLEQTIDINATHAMFYDNEQSLIFSKGNDLYKWDLKNNTEVDKVINGHDKAIRAVNITLDEKYFVTASNDNKINFWDKESFTKIPHFSGDRPDQITQVDFTRDHKNMYSIVDQKRIQFWNLEKGKIDYLSPQLDRKGLPSAFHIGSDREYMAVCGTQNKGVEIWNIKKGEAEVNLPYTSFISKAVLIPNSKMVAGLGKDRKVVIWDRENPGQTLAAMTGHRGTIYAITVSNDGNMLFTAGKDKTVKVWDTESKTLKHSVSVGMQVNSLAISPDDGQLIVGCGNTTKVFAGTSESALYALDVIKLADYAAPKGMETVLGLSGHSAAISHVSYSNDGSKFVSGGHDTKAIVWDATTLSPIQTFNGHSAEVTSLTFSKGDKHLVSGSKDATTKFWNLSTGQSEFNMVTFDDGKEYIVYDNSNYYSCTKNGAKNVHFVIDNEVYLFEQFDLRLNRPDLVYANLPGINKGLLKAYRKAYLKRLKKMNFTEDMLSSDFHIPELTILNENEIPYKVTSRTLSLNIEAKDEEHMLDRINIWINDVPVFGKSGYDLRSRSTQSFNERIDLQLSRGKNKIQVSVLNQRGAESFKATKFVYYETGAQKNDLYVIGIGVSNFSDSEFNLDYAAKDATDVVTFLSEDKTQYNNIYTRLILNEDATRNNIMSLKSFLANSQIDDNVILFVASHGLLDDELDYYLATTDVNFYKPSERGLIYEDLESLLDGIPARKKLLLIDACHSGEVDKDEVYKAPIPATSEDSGGLTAEITDIKESSIKSRGFKKIGGPGIGIASSFELMKQMFNDLRRGSGATVISSAGGKEFALESGAWNNGVFTFCFLQGLDSRDADINNDQKVDVTEIRNYVADNVKKLTNGQQNPTFRKENLDNNYTIW